MNEKKITVPRLGELWPEQGGIYCGMRLIDGAEHCVITPASTDHDLTEKNFAAAESAQFGEINCHSDWNTGEQEDYMLAYVNAREQFKCDGGLDSIYWTRSVHHGWAWAVAFEHGLVLSSHRYRECRVRPLRSFIASSI
ncbi:MAG: hypothetical protein Q8L80_07995 [Gallionella sp.]|nr:hypothetical protein [Gallionella sp.]MDP1941248.1 hypothetical protein [Gallionella sp.]